MSKVVWTKKLRLPRMLCWWYTGHALLRAIPNGVKDLGYSCLCRRYVGALPYETFNFDQIRGATSPSLDRAGIEVLHRVADHYWTRFASPARCAETSPVQIQDVHPRPSRKSPANIVRKQRVNSFPAPDFERD